MTIVDRAAGILRDEIANGALANIAASSRVWSMQRGGLIGSEATRRLRADLEALLDPVLDLIAPPARPTPAQRAASEPKKGAARARHSTQPLPVLRSRNHVVPGQAGEILTRLRNDGRHAVEVGFVCSDLVAEPEGRIDSNHLRFSPWRVRVPPGAVVDLAISLDVPAGAPPGVYHGLLLASDLAGLGALLTFPVA